MITPAATDAWPPRFAGRFSMLQVSGRGGGTMRRSGVSSVDSTLGYLPPGLVGLSELLDAELALHALHPFELDVAVADDLEPVSQGSRKSKLRRLWPTIARPSRVTAARAAGTSSTT